MSKVSVFALMLALLILGACNGLAGEPRIVGTVPPQPTIDTSNPENLGASIFVARCASCHGESGQGDGPVALEANLTPANFTLASTSANQSLTEWTNTIRFGRLDSMMPPWENSLSPEEIDAVAAYTYTFWQQFPQDEVSAAETTEEAPAIEEATGVISGEIVQGTNDAPVPEIISIALHVLDNEGNEANFEMQVIEDETAYRFEDILIRHDYSYVITAIYNEIIFYSDFVSGTPDSPEMSLPVQVYEVTHDESVIEVDLFLIRLFPEGESVIVQQLINFKNTSDQVYRGNNQIDGFTYDSVRIPLPAGADILNSVELVPRFLMLEDAVNPTILDTEPVLPSDDHLVEIVYTLPFPLTDAERSITFETPYAIDAIEIMVNPSEYSINGGELFSSTGTQHFSSGVYESFVSEALGAGSSVQFDVLPPVETNTEDSAPEGSSQNGIVMIMAVLGIGLMVISALALVINRSKESV